MNHFTLFFKNFLAEAFRKKISFLVHFGVPIATFFAMYLLLSTNESAAFAAAQAIGLVLYFTMLQAVMIVSLILRDREQGIETRIRVSPASELSYVAGNGAASLLILFAQAVVFTAVITFAVPVSLGMGFFELITVLAVFCVMSVGFAFLICSFTATSSAAMISANFILMFSSLLGGAFFPVEFMSPFLQKTAYAFPQFWTMRAIRQIQSGLPAAETGLSLLIVALFGVLFIAVQSGVKRAKSA